MLSNLKFPNYKHIFHLYFIICPTSLAILSITYLKKEIINVTHSIYLTGI